MFGEPNGGRRILEQLIARFREKGATSQGRAMTAQELGLPPRFEEAMRGRLGVSGIFVEVGGKYYLDEGRLSQVEEQRGQVGGRGGGLAPALRMARMLVGFAAVVLALSNILVLRSVVVSLLVVGLLVLWAILTAYQILALSRMRRRWAAARDGRTP